MKTTKQVTWCVYLDVTLSVQWCAANSREAQALANYPDYLVGYYSKHKDPQALEDAATTRSELRQLLEAA
jgi:hypothetical protein